jgi:hypothetical protein
MTKSSFLVVVVLAIFASIAVAGMSSNVFDHPKAMKAAAASPKALINQFSVNGGINSAGLARYMSTNNLDSQFIVSVLRALSNKVKLNAKTGKMQNAAKPVIKYMSSGVLSNLLTTLAGPDSSDPDPLYAMINSELASRK